MSTHMIGNVTPGGVHVGIFRSLKPFVCSPSVTFFKSGRELSRGEKTLDLRDKPQNSAVTACHGSGPPRAASAATSIAPNVAVTAAICTATAAPYFPIASPSSSLADMVGRGDERWAVTRSEALVGAHATAPSARQGTSIVWIGDRRSRCDEVRVRIYQTRST